MQLFTNTLALIVILSKKSVLINSKKPLGCLSESDIIYDKSSSTKTIYGTNYQGGAFLTQRRQKCLKWTGSISKRIAKGGKYFEHILTIKELDGSANHNYCRNPDGSAYPWCYIQPKKLKLGVEKNWDYCMPLKPCKNGIQKLKGQKQANMDGEEPMCGLSCKEGYKHCTIDLSKPDTGPKSKMTGGEPAKPGEFPWMASLYDPCFNTRKNKPCKKIGSNRENEDGQIFCGASILNRNWILTAANCIQTKDKETNYKTFKAANGKAEATRAMALVGYKDWHETPDRTLKEHRRRHSSLGRDEIPILKFIVHEDYDPKDREFYVLSGINDIALGLLDRPVNYNNLMDVGGMTLVRPRVGTRVPPRLRKKVEKL